MKYQAVSNLLTDIVQFTNEHRIEISVYFFTVDELRNMSEDQANYWSMFEKFAGTYCFFDIEKDSLLYVGMSESDTGSRLFNWLFKDEKIHSRVSSDDLIMIISFAKQFYMAPALESYLIDLHQPELNKVKKRQNRINK